MKYITTQEFLKLDDANEEGKYKASESIEEEKKKRNKTIEIITEENKAKNIDWKRLKERYEQ